MSFRHVLNDCLGCRRMTAADDEIAVRIARRKNAIGEFGCVRVVRIVRVTRRRRGLEVKAAEIDEECSLRVRGVGPGRQPGRLRDRGVGHQQTQYRAASQNPANRSHEVRTQPWHHHLSPTLEPVASPESQILRQLKFRIDRAG